jgi:nucleotide-binding universal stress UspA family protein
VFRSFLVPLDGSDFAEQALPLAFGIARRAAAALHLVRVHVPSAALYPVMPMESMGTDRDQPLAEAERSYLDGVARRLAATTAAPVTSALVHGPVVDGILEQARSQAADLILMTTHGLGPLSRFWLGSVADELVRRSSVPVLLVRPQEPPPDLTSEVGPHRILIPLDGSPLAERVVEPAIALGG